MRREYEMTQEDLEGLLRAINDAGNIPMIMLQCGPRRSIQEVANDAWGELGKKMGFKYMTVLPSEKGNRYFTAEPVDG